MLSFLRVIALGLLLGPVATAGCLRNLSNVWPPSGTVLPRNPELVISGDGMKEAWVYQIEEHRPYLWGPSGKVPLVVVEVVRDQSGSRGAFAQASLRPARRLEPYARYDLRFDHEAPFGFVSWRTSGSEDRRLPDGCPVVDGSFQITDQGFGTIRGVIQLRDFSVDGPGRAVVTIVPEPSRRWDRPFLVAGPMDRNEFHLQSGECGGCEGRYWLRPGRSYRFYVDLFDMAGNRIRAESRVLRIPPFDRRWMVKEEVFPPTRILSRVEPIYPAIARKADVFGVVDVSARIAPDGRVVAASVIRSIPLLDEASVDAVRAWQFEAADETRCVVVKLWFLMLRRNIVCAVP